jgi:apolipoprotein N-acyltransferase
LAGGIAVTLAVCGGDGKSRPCRVLRVFRAPGFHANARTVTLPRLSPPLAGLAALIAGTIAALGFEPWRLWPLTLLAVAALVVLVAEAPRRRTAFFRGWLFGVGHFSLGLAWIATAFTYQAKMPPALGWVAVVGLSMFLALYIGLAAALSQGFARRPLALVLGLAACWMLGEWLRGWVLTGFAWNPLGAAWLPLPGLPQLARLGGGVSLSGVMVLAGGALWLLLQKRQRRTGAVLLAVLALAGVAGTLLVGGGDRPDAPEVFLIQPNIGQDERYAAGSEERHLRTYLEMTTAALAARGSPRGALVVWSEGSVPWLIEEEPEVRAALGGVLGPDDLLLFGGTAAVRDTGGRLTALTNSLFVIDARGVLHGRFDKAHLVPLGEYVPAKPLMTALGLARLVPGDLEFLPGPGPRTLELPGFPAAGMQICYEIIFPGAVVDRANRPQWIVNVSNDAWYGPSGPPQHLAQARLRAIEEGLPIARATPTGISAMVDANGDVVAAVPFGRAGAAVALLPPARTPGPYALLGDWTTALFGGLLLGVALWVNRRSGGI